MYSIKLDENKYFAGDYAKVGKVAGGINIPTLPPDMSKATCYKWGVKEVNHPIQVPVLDKETGEQSIDENGNPIFEMQDNIVTVADWVFDEDKYNEEINAQQVEKIRQQREEAFKVIDKYQLVLCYNSLTDEEKDALTEYRQLWLDAPKTGVIPTMPACFKL